MDDSSTQKQKEGAQFKKNTNPTQGEKSKAMPNNRFTNLAVEPTMEDDVSLKEHAVPRATEKETTK